MKDKADSQLEAVSHIKRFLAQKGLNLPSRDMKVGNEAGAASAWTRKPGCGKKIRLRQIGNL